MERRKALLLGTSADLASDDNAPSTLDAGDISRIIEMAWEDRTTFEAIQAQFGLNQDAVIKLMRAQLKLSSFKLWRERTHGQKTKHQHLRSPEVTRHKANHRVKQF